MMTVEAAISLDTGNRSNHADDAPAIGSEDEPYYIVQQRPPSKDQPLWTTTIRGPMVAVVHLGTEQYCGPHTVRLLNLAYKAGKRASS